MIHKKKIIDSTLREGEQTPGLCFTLGDKNIIIDGLARVGVSEIEVGISSPFYPDNAQLIRHIRCNHEKIQSSLWCRCNDNDIDHALTLNPDVLSLSIPVSDLHIREKLGKDRTWIETTMKNAIRRAVRSNIQVAIGFEDATRADVTFLTKMSALAQKEGVFRIRLADTVGRATPFEFGTLVSTIKKAVGTLAIGVHTHNDFGMATANAITGLENGAEWADTTILGLGERTGCAKLEEVAGYLALIANDTSLHPEELHSLAKCIEEISGTLIPENQPIVGKRIFTCETGLHLQGLFKNPATYESYPPEKVGACRSLLIGAKSGKRALAHKLQELGHDLSEVSETTLHSSLQRVRDYALISRAPLTDEELLHVIHG